MTIFTVVYWDGELLSAIIVRNSKEERVPVVAGQGRIEKLIITPKLENSSEKEQTRTFSNL